MPASRLHLVRHGEVFNPDEVLYGRLPGFGLSERGQQMAAAAAVYLAGLDRPVTALYASPLQRAQESAAPISATFGLSIAPEARVLEPTNAFEGKRMHGPDAAPKQWQNWRYLVNPLRPSWGEPYASIAARMLAAMRDAWAATEGGDVVIVSHQLPIWTAHREIAGERLWHDPRERRCNLSSITSFELKGDAFTEVGYADPAAGLLEGAIDVGAV